MSSILSKLSGVSSSKTIEPREIFMSLPMRDKQYEYPRDVQTDVWTKWFKSREQKNTIIKMNTGSGKTIVGLMILQSCLNEGKSPAIYVVPDNYLVSQVCLEAKKLGINAVKDKDDFDYTNGKAILVTNIHTLVNGNSFFGMRTGAGNYHIESVLFDDVHACLDTINEQYTIRISRNKHNELYEEIIEIISESWKSYYKEQYTDIIEIKRETQCALLPFWIWQGCCDKVYPLLRSYEKNKNSPCMGLSLFGENLSTCNCVITSREIEIKPQGIDISKITSFDSASRRIFMSATLADDSVFISSLGLHMQDIKEIITPQAANDIGDRLMVFPEHQNHEISSEEIRQKLANLSKKYNVVVITPSYEHASLWENVGAIIANKENIKETVDALRSNHVGLVVFVNRYNGIDLPNNACRILVIDDLPPLNSSYSAYVQSIDPNNRSFLREQIQKIEQGIGRGVRSNNDFCVVVFMGHRLADILIRNRATEFFSNATLEQYRLSKELWELLHDDTATPTIDDVFSLAEFSLNRDEVWIEKSKARLSAIKYKSNPNIDQNIMKLREVFECSLHKDWTGAVAILNDIENNETDDKTKGLFMQIKAGYLNFYDKIAAQQLLKSARRYNGGVFTPIEGIQTAKTICNAEQAVSIISFAGSISSNPNEQIMYIHSLLDALSFSQHFKGFEQELNNLGYALGFVPSRPEHDGTHGPDNLWAIGNGAYIVFECKNETQTGFISKRDCNQLTGSGQWFQNTYIGNHYTYTPVMIHCSNTFESDCSPAPNTRIMTSSLLEKMKKHVLAFYTELVSIHSADTSNVVKLLTVHKLRNTDIIREYTEDFQIKR